MRRIISVVLTIPIVALMLASCEDKFKSRVQPSARLTTDSPTSSSSSSGSKSWRSPVFIDMVGLDTVYNYDSGISGTTGPKYPMASFSDAAQGFGSILTQKQVGVTTNYFSWLSYPNPFTTDYWAGSLSQFTRIDSGIASYQMMRSEATVDSSGNVGVLSLGMATSTSKLRPVFTRKNSTNASWSSATDISLATMTASYDALDRSMAIASDYSGNMVSVWCQGDTGGNPYPYYNEYRKNIGLRFGTTTLLDMTVDATTTYCSANDYGIDIAFNNQTVGYISFIDNATGGAVIKRWQSDGWYGAVEALTGASADAFPKIMMDSSGNAIVVFYRNFVAATGTADLYTAECSQTAACDPPVLLDTGVSAYYTGDDYNTGTKKTYLAPVIANRGDYGMLFYIKSDGTSRRLWYSINSGGTWSTPDEVDDGGAGLDVVWASAAVNASGKYVVAYSQIGADTFEHVYANVYSNGVWEGNTQLDTEVTLTGSAAPAAMRPSVAIDSSGNAVASFYALKAGVRRAMAASYR